MTTPDLTFGPPGGEWTYHRASKSYDLTRKSVLKFTLSTSHGDPSRLAVDLKYSVLIIVDMQNFFLSPQCRDHPLGLKAVAPTIRVIEKCREIGMAVVWLNWGLTDEDLENMPAGVQRGFSRSLISGTGTKSGLGSDLGNGQGRTLCAGTWNADIYDELKSHVRPQDEHCAKNRMSGLWNEEQPLWKYLYAGDKLTLFFAGVNTDQCVGGTLSNAYNAGWDVVMLDDCCATTTENGREVWMHNVANNYGFVTNSEAFCVGELARNDAYDGRFDAALASS